MPEMIAVVDDLIGENRSISISETAMEIKISVGSAHTIVGEELHYRKSVHNALFPHRNIYKASWKSPDGSTTNQIHHVLKNDHHESSLQDVRRYRGANIDSDHFLKIAGVWSKLKKQHITPRTIGRKDYDIMKLNDLEVATRYMNNLKSQIGINDYSIE
jgi:hypothetical protein